MGWEQRVGVSTLLDRMSNGPQMIAALGEPPQAEIKALGRPIRRLHSPFAVQALAGPSLTRWVKAAGIELIHAWGMDAAATACSATDCPVVLELFDPLLATRHAKLLRTLAQSPRFAVVCSCEIVRRRLIEHGVPAEQCVVIRPGVDFALLTRVRRGGLRQEFGVRAGEVLCLLPEPVTRESGGFEAFWATVLLHDLGAKVRILVAGFSKEQERIARFMRTLPDPPPLLATGDRYPFEQLLAVSDVLLLAPRGDVPTTAIAWAMAANVSVIGSAVPAIAELIAHKVNGLLFKPPADHTPAIPIVKLLRDRESQRRTQETARGQAYEVFGLRRNVEQHARVYENLLNGESPSGGIADSAQVG